MTNEEIIRKEEQISKIVKRQQNDTIKIINDKLQLFEHKQVLNKIKSEYVAECSDCGNYDDCDDKSICFDFSAIQALNLAIQVLEQELSEDCISREGLYEE